jgi:hypothetical protein
MSSKRRPDRVSRRAVLPTDGRRPERGGAQDARGRLWKHQDVVGILATLDRQEPEPRDAAEEARSCGLLYVRQTDCGDLIPGRSSDTQEEMAFVVGLGTRAEPASVQADGRSAVWRGRSSEDA